MFLPLFNYFPLTLFYFLHYIVHQFYPSTQLVTQFVQQSITLVSQANATLAYGLYLINFNYVAIYCSLLIFSCWCQAITA